MNMSPRLNVPGWFISVVLIVSSIVTAGYTVGSQVGEIRADLHEQSKAVNQRLCRIEYAVGLVPNKVCDVSEFLIPGDDSKVIPRGKP